MATTTNDYGIGATTSLYPAPAGFHQLSAGEHKELQAARSGAAYALAGKNEALRQEVANVKESRDQLLGENLVLRLQEANLLAINASLQRALHDAEVRLLLVAEAPHPPLRAFVSSRVEDVTPVSPSLGDIAFLDGLFDAAVSPSLESLEAEVPYLESPEVEGVIFSDAPADPYLAAFVIDLPITDANCKDDDAEEEEDDDETDAPTPKRSTLAPQTKRLKLLAEKEMLRKPVSELTSLLASYGLEYVTPKLAAVKLLMSTVHAL